jgi:hypothetical protein
MKKNNDNYRQNLCTLRKQTKKSMKTITRNLREIERLRTAEGKTPENDFARIFEDEAVYFEMLKGCLSAYNLSYLSKLKLCNPEHIENIQNAAISAGIEVPSKRRLADPRVKNKIIADLQQKKTPSGGSYLEQAQRMALYNKERRKFENECNLCSTLFKISSTPLEIGDLYRETWAGKDCVGWRLCKTIGEAVRKVLREWDSGLLKNKPIIRKES